MLRLSVKTIQLTMRLAIDRAIAGEAYAGHKEQDNQIMFSETKGVEIIMSVRGREVTVPEREEVVAEGVVDKVLRYQ
jgi:hypothetical protein